MKRKIKLNLRQWRLHEFLKKQSDYLSFKEVCITLGYENEETFEPNVRGYRMLVKDIKAIKEYPGIKKIPVTDRAKGVKYAATEKEQLKEINFYKHVFFESLEMIKILEDKASLEGQMRLKLTPYQKELVESLNRLGVEESG